MSGPAGARFADWLAGHELRTPVHLFDAMPVRDGIARLRAELAARVSFAVKANTHPLMLDEVVHGPDPVDEFNVTNLAHLDLLLAEGVGAGRITFVHPVCTEATVAAVLDRGVRHVVLDDRRGLGVLTAVSAGRDVRVTLRLRPQHGGQASRSVIRFGADRASLRGLARSVADSPSLALAGLSFFVGTHGEGLTAGMPYHRAITEAAALADDLDRDGLLVPSLNIGGGFPGGGRPVFGPGSTLLGQIRGWVDERFPDGTDVICEPGRFLAEPSMTMLSTVVADRVVCGRRMTHLDVSAYSGLFETTYIDDGGESLRVVPLVEPDRGESTTTQLLGPIMDSFDVLKRDVPLPPLRPGDLVLMPDTGAYSFDYYSACEGTGPARIVAAPDWFTAQRHTPVPAAAGGGR